MTPFARQVSATYLDPLDAIWIAAARRIGLRLARSAEVYASTDGRGTLTLTTPDGFDPDDCLAQMILHELCHSLVMGPASFEVTDWGLDNTTARDALLEHACLRTQAALLTPLGLRQALGPTTDFRAYYDELPENALGGRDDGAIALARQALARRHQHPWGPHLERALAATGAICQAAWQGGAGEAPGASVYQRIVAPLPRHATGIPLASDPEVRCGDCGWGQASPTGVHCLQANQTVDPAARGCERFEGPLDCQRCGACCREAYDVVELDPDDPALGKHRHLFVFQDGRATLPRDGGRCGCLRGGPPSPRDDLPGGGSHEPGADLVAYTCAIYDDRPWTCRDFERGSDHCLQARRKVGLSR